MTIEQQTDRKQERKNKLEQKFFGGTDDRAEKVLYQMSRWLVVHHFRHAAVKLDPGSTPLGELISSSGSICRFRATLSGGDSP